MVGGCSLHAFTRRARGYCERGFAKVRKPNHCNLSFEGCNNCVVRWSERSCVVLHCALLQLPLQEVSKLLDSLAVMGGKI